MQTVVIQSKGSSMSLYALCTTNFFERAKGLIGSSITNPNLLIAPCSSIHSFCMSYPIDVAFISCDLQVVFIKKELSPARVLSCPRADRDETKPWAVLERPASTRAWFEVGDRLEITKVTQDALVLYSNQGNEREE